MGPAADPRAGPEPPEATHLRPILGMRVPLAFLLPEQLPGHGLQTAVRSRMPAGSTCRSPGRASAQTSQVTRSDRDLLVYPLPRD